MRILKSEKAELSKALASLSASKIKWNGVSEAFISDKYAEKSATAEDVQFILVIRSKCRKFTYNERVNRAKFMKYNIGNQYGEIGFLSHVSKDYTWGSKYLKEEAAVKDVVMKSWRIIGFYSSLALFSLIVLGYVVSKII